MGRAAADWDVLLESLDDLVGKPLVLPDAYGASPRYYFVGPEAVDNWIANGGLTEPVGDGRVLLVSAEPEPES